MEGEGDSRETGVSVQNEILESSICRGDGKFGGTVGTWGRQVREGDIRMNYCVPHLKKEFKINI